MRESWSIGPLDFVFTERYTWAGQRLPGTVLHVFYRGASPYRHVDLMKDETLADAKKLAGQIAAERFNEWLAEANALINPPISLDGWF